MDPVEEKWQEAKAALLEAIGNAQNPHCRIPGWSEVGMDEALPWFQSQTYEGFYVRFKVEDADGSCIVWFKSWEYGEDEPEWASVKEQWAG